MSKAVKEKTFFFEKKNQKTFVCLIPAVPRSDSFVIMSDTLAGDS
jgi:hypothetical protein